MNEVEGGGNVLGKGKKNTCMKGPGQGEIWHIFILEHGIEGWRSDN